MAEVDEQGDWLEARDGFGQRHVGSLGRGCAAAVVRGVPGATGGVGVGVIRVSGEHFVFVLGWWEVQRKTQDSD
jgi:hypothetical protein